MSDVGPPAAPARAPDRGRWLPLLLVPVALLPDLAAALPLRSYFFRDFTVTFLPLRLFAARELRAGRFPFWNPYVFEGSFQLPALYPPDLLHALWPAPVFVSWLLTLHLPLAALGAYWLSRELGTTRVGAFVTGVVFGLCGFTLSSLNLYVFLQALALAPFVALLLRRAALAGGRGIVAAAALVALATTTLAVEFVAQAVLLGVALGMAVAGRRAVARLALALALGVGLAAVPVGVVLGLLPETSRGAGFTPDVALANAVHPAVLLQAVLPHLFGDPSAPAEAWWGGRFFSKGLPYFLSLYLGPLVVSLALLGVGVPQRRVRRALLVPAALGAWYALGSAAGLATLAQLAPFGPSFRFPSKALLLPQLAVALLAGFGTDRLRDSPACFARLATLVAGWAALGIAIAALLQLGPRAVVDWSGVLPAYWPIVGRVVWGDAFAAALLAGAVGFLALAVRRTWLPCRSAVALLAALIAGDLARAGAGLNRQVPQSFFELLPETAALPLRAEGRVFSYGVNQSPAFRTFLARGGPTLTLAGLFLDRQVLGPYTNMLDRLESPEATDLTAFAPRAPELDAGLYDPARVAELLPWLRNASVSRVLSLDRLQHAELAALGVVPTGVAGLSVHVYGVDAWPRAYVACRVVEEPDAERAMVRVYEPWFDPRRDVVLARAPGASCSSGSVRPGAAAPGRESFQVRSDGDGYLVLRGSYARGWRASVDRAPSPVWRANGKHRAVAIPAGEHRVETWYDPPGLRAGLLTSVLALAGAAAVALRAREAS